MKKKDSPTSNNDLTKGIFNSFGLSRRQFVKTGAVAAAGITIVPGHLLAGAATAIEFYVAVNGKDGNPGSKSKPFATFTRARDEVRKLISKGLASNVLIWIGGGIYTLSETLVLGPEDSGNDKYSVTWAGIPGEDPVISSGIKIEGWKELEETPVELPGPARGKVWVADVPESLGRFYTLYDKQGHLQRAQSDGFIPDEPPAGVDPKDREILLRNLYYPEGVIRNWDNIDDVEIVIRPSVRWTMNILALESVDEQTRMARTKLPATYGLRRIGKEKYKTVWVENIMEALHEPGNWVLNTHTRKLYLWPRTDTPVDIRAPRLQELIRVEGKIDVNGPIDIPVKNLVFTGLTFAHADRDLWNENDIGIQHDWEMIDKSNGLLRFRGSENCTVLNCKFRDSGGNAIRLDLYARKNRIEGNEIRFMGQGGIILIGYGPGTKDVNNSNEIINNHIHHSGLIYWHSHAVVIWQSGGNRVANNYIHHMPRKAVCLSGVRLPYFQRENCISREICRSLRWNEIGEKKKTWEECMPFLHTKKNLIEDNEVERVLQKMGDGASINVTGAGRGNYIRHNYLHDIFASEWVSGVLRTDDFQDGTTWENNVIYRANCGAWEHKGNNNVINNFVIDVFARGYFRIFRDSIDGSVIQHNIFFNTNGEAIFYTYAIGPQQVAKTKLDYNLYFCGGVMQTGTPKFLETIRAQGVGKNDAYDDPLFEDLKPWNFKLKLNSPALKMGIKQIDLTGVGLTKDFPKQLMG